MLESLDLSLSLPKEEYRKSIQPLHERLRDLQLILKDSRRPVIIVFEGLPFAGKGDCIRQIASPLDPHGYKVYLTRTVPDEDARMRPSLWRFWMRIPGRGEIAIFDKAWYMPFITQRVNRELDDTQWSAMKDAVKQFERQLVDDGTIILKFWLHLSKTDQKKRFETISKSPYEGWRVTKEDWQVNRQFGKYCLVSDEIIMETDTPYAPWTIVPSTDKRYRRIQVLRTIVETLDRSVKDGVRTITYVSATASPRTNNTRHPTVLDRSDLSKSIERDEYTKKMKMYQNRLRQLEYACYAKRLPIVVLYEGWDASGKGGSIKRITDKLDPHGYSVIPIAKPEGDEATHHYLWRFWRQLPKAGHIAIFDRSWYGRVMVERVEGFCTEEEWKRAFYEINEFERQLAEYGTVIVKFWFHISQEEQLRRFKLREQTPHKMHKLTEEDWRNREKWDLYAQAVSEMIERTSTQFAPWTIVEGDNKPWARVKSIRTIVKAIEAKLK